MLSVNYFFYHHFSELLAVSVLAAIAFAAFLLEDDHLVTLYEGLHHFYVHFCSFNGRSTDFDVAVGIQQEDFVKADFVALFNIAEVVDIQIFAGFGFELQSLNFYDCVHEYYLTNVFSPLGRQPVLRLFSLGG